MVRSSLSWELKTANMNRDVRVKMAEEEMGKTDLPVFSV